MSPLHPLRAMPVAFIALLLVAPASHAANGYVDAQIALSLEPGHSIEAVNAAWETQSLDEIPGENLYLVEYLGSGSLFQTIQDMRDDPGIAMAELNYYRETPESIRQMVISSTGLTFEEYADQELTTRIGLDAAHECADGTGVLVAVLDTGIDAAHPAFAGRFSPNGYDFVDDDADPSETANGIDDDEDTEIDEGYGHGTMVAGLVALVAPGATILVLRVLNDEGRSHAFVVAKAIHYARQQGARVVNMSFGAPTASATINAQVVAGYNEGIVMVAGAGNENNATTPYYPGALDETIMVTALDAGDVKADFADYHSVVDLSAPGVAVASAYPGNDYAAASGCSFATPIVSGQAALVLDKVPWADPVTVASMVEGGVDGIYEIPENAPFNGLLGTGRVNLQTTVAATTAAPDGDPALPGMRAVPNPARGRVSLWVPGAPGSRAGVEIFDLAGHLVRRLEGPAPLVWTGRDEHDRRVPAGVYYARPVSAGTAAPAIRIVWSR